MKKFNIFKSLSIVAAFVFMASLTIGCVEGAEGPMGLTGAAGEKGDTGAKGDAGLDGKDGANGSITTCVMCHDGVKHPLAKATYMLSNHNLDELVEADGTVESMSEMEGTSTSCSRCHSSEGFQEITFTKANWAAKTMVHPTKITCNTCHNHGDFSFTNNPNALRTIEAVTPIMYNFTKPVLDLKGPSNLCITCHQGRDRSFGNFATANYDWTPSFTASTATGTVRFNAHYGVQSQVLLGVMGYQGFTNPATPFNSTAHKDMTTCTMCHMGSGVSGATLNHSMKPDVANCKACHGTITDFNVNGKQTEIIALEADLKAELVRLGLIDAVTGSVISARYGNATDGYTNNPNGFFVKANKTKISHDVAGSLLNYGLAHYDKSNGVHNYKYTLALLKNSIAYLKTL